MSGISNIISIIDSKTDQKVEGILREAELHKKKVLDDAKLKAKKVSESILEKAETESKAELSRQEASAKLKAKYKFLEAKEGILKEIIVEAESELEKTVKSKNYGDVLTQLAVTGGIALNEEKLEIVLPKGQDSLVTTTAVEKAISDEIGKKVSVKIAKENIRATGGLIIRTEDNTRWVDNTFEARMERYESKIRDEISSLLFKEE